MTDAEAADMQYVHEALTKLRLAVHAAIPNDYPDGLLINLVARMGAEVERLRAALKVAEEECCTVTANRAELLDVMHRWEEDKRAALRSVAERQREKDADKALAWAGGRLSFDACGHLHKTVRTAPLVTEGE